MTDQPEGRETGRTPANATLPWREDPDHPSRILPTVRTPGSRVVVEVHHRDDLAEVQAIRALVVSAVNERAALLEALRGAVDAMSESIAADCYWCDGVGSWTEDTTPRMIPVKHKAECPYEAARAALSRAEQEVKA